MDKSEIGRFKDADFVQESKDVLLVGLGGIGNGVFQHLINCQQRITVFEDDTVEQHNCVPQGYFQKQVGEKKYTAAFGIATERLNNCFLEPSWYNEKYDKDSIAYPVMIAAVDSYEARKTMFENWRQQEDRELFLDGRLLAEFYQIFAITKETEDWYWENWCQETEEGDPAPCTYQQTSFASSIIGGKIVQKYLNYITGKPFNMYERYEGTIDYHLFL